MQGRTRRSCPGPFATGPQGGRSFDMSTFRQEVAVRAHARWSRNGRPHETQVQDWLEAEAELGLIAAQAQQLAEKALMESSQLLQAVLENSTAIVSVKDVQGRYVLVNRHFEDLFGVTWS